MQLTFGDAEGMGKRKRTRKEIFLAEMDKVVPWAALLALIAPHYPKMGRPGRQPYPLATMLRVHFLQQWYALSDPAMEEALYDTAVMRRFARLSGLDNIPDETTILNFRRLLETHHLAPQILERVNAHLARKGQSLKAGTIVDATIIAAPSSTKNKVLLPTEGREAHGRPGRLAGVEAPNWGRPWPRWIVCPGWEAGRGTG